MIDYHRIYGLRSIVFRQSCIYGYRQFGAEDQGWVAWFMIASQLGRPITIYGDGKQVRDILFIDDLLDAYDAAFAAPDKAAGRAFNIGGGVGNVHFVAELLAFIEQRSGAKLPAGSADWRPGDQKVFISDIRRAQAELGWSPKVSCPQGLGLLYDWIEKNRELFLKLSPTSGMNLQLDPPVEDNPVSHAPSGHSHAKLRVLHVGKFYPPHMGGIETHLQALCGALRNHADVRVIVSSEDRNTIEETVDQVPVARLSTLLTAFSTSISPAHGVAHSPFRRRAGAHPSAQSRRGAGLSGQRTSRAPGGYLSQRHCEAEGAGPRCLSLC